MNTIKEDMEKYWTQRAEKFSALRKREFLSEKHAQWLQEIEKHLPNGKKLNILDIGTGTGFFALLLAERGHHVTGIDLTPEMIKEAKRLSEELHLSADFFVMDAEEPKFPKGYFDAIVTRKLTWTLPNLPKAYRAWHELLKPNGVLINFDADYCREKKAELPPHHAHQDVGDDLMNEYERMKTVLRENQLPRPQWDRELLLEAGFSSIDIDDTVWERVYVQKDEFYDPTKGFAIIARA